MMVEGHPDLRWVAWHGRSSGAYVRIGLRHIARSHGKTLCGRLWKRPREVTPNDYWTEGDCTACLRALARITPGTPS